MSFTKKIIGDELYLYNSEGKLIFKRWIKQKYSLIFTPFTYGKDTLVSITDDGIKKKTHD